MIIKKIKQTVGYSYKTYVTETDHHILLDDEFEDWVCDYIDNDHELLSYIFNVLDDGWELFICKAKEVAWSPYKEWFFIY